MEPKKGLEARMIIQIVSDQFIPLSARARSPENTGMVQDIRVACQTARWRAKWHLRANGKYSMAVTEYWKICTVRQLVSQLCHRVRL